MKPLILLVVALAFMVNSITLKGQAERWFEEGKSEAGKKTGLWKYYDSPGNLSLVYDHTLEKVVFNKPDTTKSLVSVGQEWELRSMDNSARPKGSYEELYSYLQKEVTAKVADVFNQFNASGEKLYVGFSVDSKGRLADISLLNVNDAKINELFISIFQRIPFSWIPAQKGSEVYTSIVAMPIVLCKSCSGFLPRISEKEDIPLPCPVLPQLTIQFQAYKQNGHHPNRTRFLNDPSTTILFSGFLNYNHAGPDWSPDDSKLAFLYQDNIYTFDVGTKNIQQLTHSYFAKSNLNWSPKGILYNQENNYGVDEVFLFRVDSGKSVNLSRELKWSEFEPRSSPEGHHIYFHSAKNKGRKLFYVDADNRRKASVPGAPQEVLEYLVSTTGKVAILERKDGKDLGVSIIDTDGQRKTIISNDRNSGIFAWLPNEILIASRSSGQFLNVVIIDSQSGAISPLPLLKTEALSRIQFCGYTEGGSELFMMRGARGQYDYKGQLFEYSMSSGKFREITKQVNGLISATYNPTINAFLLRIKQDCFLLKNEPDSKPERIIEDCYNAWINKAGNLVCYINYKTRSLNLYDINLKTTIQLALSKEEKK